MQKTLFFDIDGTLVSFETHQIPASTRFALRKARHAGHKIFISTGRPFALINNLGYMQQNDLIDGYITMNGAYCFVGDEVIYKNALPTDEAAAIIHFCKENGNACILVSEHDVEAFQPNDMLHRIFYKHLQVNELAEVNDAENNQRQLFQLTPFITQEEEQLLLPHIPNCECARWYPAFADITAIGNTKQHGIDEILRHTGLDLADTIAFGDGGNDISMLQHAAIGVAMGQADDSVKAHADYITTSVDDDGIYNAMRQLQLI